MKTMHQEAVIGLSGGIDSAVVACIAAEAIGPENVYGVSLPSKFSSEHSLTDAQELANNLGIDYRIIPIQDAVEGVERTLYSHFLGMKRDITEENIQASAATVKDAVDPLDDFRGSADYKRQMAEVLTRRAVTQALASGL